MDATLLILEQRFATFILLNVYKNPGIIKQKAIDFDNGAGRAKYSTLEKLIRAQLIREDEGKYQYNLKCLYCTEIGKKVCVKLLEIYDILPKIECECYEYKGNSQIWNK